VTATLVVTTHTAEETRRIGRALGEAARPGDVLLLEGSFGVGKTVLVQGLAAGLGVPEAVTSPSFVLMVEHQGRLPLYHVDLYRLGGHLDDEMLDNLADYQEAGGVCAIEWPDALPAKLRAGATAVSLAAPDDTTREITIESPDARLVSAVRAALGAPERGGAA
jgi:tRNA threonylcarbamoyladenosine biosynthesis protein TsaE